MEWPFGRGPTTRSLGDLLRMGTSINHLLTGMILQVSDEKNPPTFHYTGWLIGILDPYNGLL